MPWSGLKIWMFPNKKHGDNANQHLWCRSGAVLLVSAEALMSQAFSAAKGLKHRMFCSRFLLALHSRAFKLGGSNMLKVDALDITGPLPRNLARKPAVTPLLCLQQHGREKMKSISPRTNVLVHFPYPAFEQPPHDAKEAKDGGPRTPRWSLCKWC